MNILSIALKANALFSATSGITLILFHTSIASIFGVQNAMPFWIVGIMLVLFATTVYLEARQTPKRIRPVKFIIIQDLLWVLASFVIIAFHLFNLSIAGYWIIAIIAIIVGSFAYAQWRGIEQLNNPAVSNP